MESIVLEKIMQRIELCANRRIAVVTPDGRS